MIFNSFTYLLFLVAAVCLYWTLPRMARLGMLFVASIIFYGFWRFDFVPLLMISVITDYLAARYIEGARDQAQRKLVLASRVGGHKELVQDGETGWLFDPDDPAALADAVDRALEQRDQWPRILDAGRAYVERERTWAHSVAAYPELFRRIGIGGGG